MLLADEPLDGLDPPSREVFFELLAEARAGGAAVVVSTTPRRDRRRQPRLGIREGRLVYDGPPEPEAIEEFFEYTVADRG